MLLCHYYVFVIRSIAYHLSYWERHKANLLGCITLSLEMECQNCQVYSMTFIIPLLSDRWLDESEKQMKKTLKTKILDIVPAKCDSWIICDVDIFYSQTISDLNIFDSSITCDLWHFWHFYIKLFYHHDTLVLLYCKHLKMIVVHSFGITE